MYQERKEWQGLLVTNKTKQVNRFRNFDEDDLNLVRIKILNNFENPTCTHKCMSTLYAIFLYLHIFPFSLKKNTHSAWKCLVFSRFKCVFVCML